jgi:hypothetical protein
MLSLRSLALILCSAMRRARALSCAALHCVADIINGRKTATSNETKIAMYLAASMHAPTNNYTSQDDIRCGCAWLELGC